MGILKFIFLAGLLSSQVASRSVEFESIESLEDQLATSFEEGSDEISLSEELALSSASYSPEEDGDPDVWVDNYMKSLKPGYSPTGGEAALRQRMRASYQKSLGQPLPVPSAKQLSKLDMKLNNAELVKHNELRARHGAGPLEYDSTLAAYAQNFAEESAARAVNRVGFFHNPQNDIYKVGENMAEDVRPTPLQYGKVDDWVPENKGHSANMWYKEIEDYKRNGNQPSSWPATGHFTQVVWKGTKKMGCGQSCYKDGRFNKCLVICNYYPAGNMGGNGNKFFKQNVQV